MLFILSGQDDEDGVFPSPSLENLQPPSFLESLKPQEVRQGSTLRLECRAALLPSAEIQWYKDDTPLEMNSRVRTLVEGDRCALMLSDVKSEDEGEYKLLLSNQSGRCECSVPVLVNEAIKAPRYVKVLAPLVVTEGEDVQLVVVVTGEPEVEWYRDDELLENGGRFVVVDAPGGDDVNSFTLAIEQCRPSDNGVYKCVSRRFQSLIRCHSWRVKQVSFSGSFEETFVQIGRKNSYWSAVQLLLRVPTECCVKLPLLLPFFAFALCSALCIALLFR